jgi:hypothetical protein
MAIEKRPGFPGLFFVLPFDVAVGAALAAIFLHRVARIAAEAAPTKTTA